MFSLPIVMQKAIEIDDIDASLILAYVIKFFVQILVLFEYFSEVDLQRLGHLTPSDVKFMPLAIS